MGETKYGCIRGDNSSHPLPMGASETFYSKSGRFVTNDASGRGELATASAAALQGWIAGGQPSDGIGGGGFDTSSTEGGDEMRCIDSLDAVFRIPLAYDASSYTVNYSSALIGETCDLVVINEVQYANPTASSYDIIQIVGGKAASSAWTDGSVNGVCLGDGYLDVKMIAAKKYSTGVGD